MIEDQKIWAYEKNYLSRVAEEIKKQLDMGIHAVENYKHEAIALQKSMWEDLRCAPSSLFDLEDVAQINQLQMELKNRASIYRFSGEKVNRLKKMQQSPYFGRIDFLEDGEQTAEQIYIGIHSLSTDDTMDILVYDWRAPVCGMFYDYEIGPSSYTCPAGLVAGEIRLKRQYKIVNSNIVYMFNSSLSINDEMLQELLGKSTSSRMRTVVTSIQKEQNTIIRNSEDKILIVEGPAGSGKTSIALHRAAYLLYKFRDTVKSENILIFSPNHVFEDYISHVLPELGEENIRRSTFADFFSNTINQKTETMNEQMEYILASQNPSDIRLHCIKFKSSAAFLAILKKYVQALETGAALKFEDVIYHDVLLISGDDILRLYMYQDSRLPYANRILKIRQRLLWILEDYENKRTNASLDRRDMDESRKLAEQRLRAQYDVIKNEIIQKTTVDIHGIYMNLFKDILLYLPASEENEAAAYSRFADYTIQELAQGMTYYEDLAPMIYLKIALEAEDLAASIKHIIIDEAQDYSVVQYEIFKTVFKNRHMTMLGDTNQTVNGYMNIADFNVIFGVFHSQGAKRMALTKSYRSSKELADFCTSILLKPNRSEQLDRHGAKPKVVKVNTADINKKMADDIAGLKSKGHKLIAVICKTASRCKQVYASISPFADVNLISNRNEVYHGDTIVIPSYLAKGLEFDAVLVDSVEDKDYDRQEDRKLLYTVCTRALHELHLYYTDTMSRFLSSIDDKLYAFVDFTEQYKRPT